MTTMTLAEADALAAILGAAERGAVVADAIPHHPATLTWGRARRIGCDEDPDAGRADVRSLYLYVHVAEVGEVGWRIRDLIPRYLSGWFIVDFDLGTYREAVQHEPGRRAEGWSVPPPEPRPEDLIPLPGEDGENTVNADEDIPDSNAASLLPTNELMNPAHPEEAVYFDRNQVAYVVRETTSGVMRVLTSFGHLSGWGVGTEHDIRHDQTWCPLGRWAVVGYRSYGGTGLEKGEMPNRPLRHWVFK